MAATALLAISVAFAATATALPPTPSARPSERPGSQPEKAAPRPEDDPKCLECLCLAMGSGACAAGGGDAATGLWGPFRISQPYWVDAGRPVQPGDTDVLPGAFQRCVTEPFCAVRAIKGYMNGPPALKDCDKDGRLTCKDLVLTHLSGRYDCKNIADSRVTGVETCMKPPRQPRKPTPLTDLSHV